MSIPEIISYDISKLNTSKNNLVDWKLDESRCVLLVHDMQDYFLRNLSLDTKNTLINNCHSLLIKARQNFVPVIFTAQCGDMTEDQRGLLKDFWGKGMSSDADNVRIAQPLTPLDSEIVSPKWRYSAFSKTELINTFRELGRDQIIICGVYAHIGIQATAVEAYSNDIEVFIAKDAIADFSPLHHSMALDYMAQCCAKNLSVSEVL
ncbi:phenazine antibiotic biosynthesis protein [Vibrio sp. vnigr-6D03]|uniref:Isochorismatase n=1 Tax=Vibrio nigripulchritudo SOn1 TaxID=1238450 RepID=A0AAV2VSL8_9VIBR|nr:MULTISPECIES: isochorismatase family protein [Vibrio]PKF80046.1 phenazine antibiotic biosynthesis protein [Vibrio sp. vnigr-6D03]CCO47572.1 putative isochorismatase [Vibrio nigripulchritudo SOn1]